MNKQDATVPEVLEEFMNFLKACGYCFDIDDRLDVVNDFKHPALNSEEMIVDDEREAEARALQEASNCIKYGPNGSVTFTLGDFKPSDMIDPEIPPSEPLKWVDASNGKEYTSYPFKDLSQPYKPQDY
jgi:hypothetical protein